MTITTRTGKGSALTHAELDANFTDLSSNKVSAVGSDGVITRQMLKDCGLSYYDSTTTNALDYVNGSHQRWTPNTGAQTLSLSNWAPSGNLSILLLEGVNLGAATITWPTFAWVMPDGTTTSSVSTFLTANTLRTAFKTSGTDFLVLWTRDAGTTIYARFA